MTDAYDAAADRTNLTKDQLLVWAGQQVHPDHRQYSELILFHIHGPVDPARFRRAFDDVVDESDALRTVMRVDGDWPRQEVLARDRSALDAIDLSRRPDRAAHLRDWLAGWTAEPFPAGAPLHRAALVKLGSDHFVWALHQHQLVGDGWSFGLILQAVRDRYAAHAGSGPAPSPPRPQFAEYVEWERRYRASDAWRRAAAYWAAKLAEPAEEPRFYEGRGGRASRRVHRLSCRLAEETAAVEALAARFGDGATDLNVLTLFCTACAIYVARICGVRRCVVGVPYANRGSQRFKRTIGSFMHICPLRIEVDLEASAWELATRVRAEAIATGRHQQYAVRNPVRARHYDVAVNYQKRFPAGADFAGWPIRVEWPTLGHGNHALTVQIGRYDASRTLELALDLNADAFGEAYRERARDHYRAILRGILATPHRAAGALPLLSAGELRAIRGMSAGRAVAVPERTLPDLVARGARRHPDRIALVDGDRAVTYRALDRAADRVAARLRERGVGREVVGTMLERDVGGWTTVLGILKAGAAYVPLDATHPAARLRRIVQQAGCRLAVASPAAERAIARALAGAATIRRVTVGELIGEEEPAEGGAPAAARDGGPTGTDLFYVIFTSGSTGAPKGIMVQHRGMVNHARAKIEVLGIHDRDRVAQTAPLTFDVSVWQLFAPLCVGAEAHLIDDETARDPRRLLAALAARRITIAATVPSMLAAMIEELEGGARHDLAALRRLVVTGEVLPPDLCRRWLALHPSIPLVNAYGPSECSDDVTHHLIERPPDAGARRVPVGRPIRNTTVRILDERRRPVPIGVAGELWLGGAGVGLGYLDDPERTAASFVADPYAAGEGARLYRSGDLGWYRADGAIELAGRRDDMTKIRGQRVEPGEVAAVLHEHAEVADAVVTSVEDPSGTRRLVAYVVLARAAGAPDGSEPAPDPQALRAFLRTRLPDFMVPAHVVALDRLPVTASGKVDRRALPEPPRGGRSAARPPVAPRTSLEATVAAVWSEVLGVAPVAVDDDLLALGGDSLLAARIAHRLRERLLVEVSVATVLEHSSVAALAAALATALETALGGGEEATLERALAEAERMSEAEAAALVREDA
jgi:amino acid adenylation domain-containing protein